MQIKTLQDAFAYFSDRQRCVDYVVAMRWPDGKISCPTCGSEAVTWLPTRFLFQCKGKHARRQFSVKVGTLMEDSPIALGNWLVVMWMLGGCRNGISSYEVARTIGITQKSAWFMLHRLRAGMQDDSWKLSGVIEADETYIGGRLKNKHTSKLKQNDNKQPVFGMIERGGRVIAQIVPDTKAKTLLPLITANVEPKSVVISDNAGVYDNVRWAGKSYQHHTINHAGGNYVDGSVHTNSIENFWSCVKRMLKGTYISVSPRHLNAYIIEQAFRFNVRKGFTEQQRGIVMLNGIYGRRLTYKALIAR